MAEHPEFACDATDRRSGRLPLAPGLGQRGPQVTVLVNSVGNHCFRFDWPSRLGSVQSAELSVREQGWPKPWTQTADDDASAGELLRVSSDKCIRVTATLRLQRGDGRLRAYHVANRPVPGTCPS